jgi:hypothetical protein
MTEPEIEGRRRNRRFRGLTQQGPDLMRLKTEWMSDWPVLAN